MKLFFTSMAWRQEAMVHNFHQCVTGSSPTWDNAARMILVNNDCLVWVHPTALSYWLEVGIPEAASRQRWVNPDPGGQKGPQRRGEVIPCMLLGCLGSRALELAFCLWGNGGYCRIQPEKEKKKNFKCLLIILLIRVFCCILLTMQIKAGVCGAQKTSAHQRWGTKQNAPRAVLPLLCLQECMQGRSVLLCCTLLRCALHSPTHCCHF